MSFTVWLYLSQTDFPAFRSLHTSSQQAKNNQEQSCISIIFNFREVLGSAMLLCSTQATTGMPFWPAPWGSAEAKPQLTQAVPARAVSSSESSAGADEVTRSEPQASSAPWSGSPDCYYVCTIQAAACRYLYKNLHLPQKKILEAPCWPRHLFFYLCHRS